MQTSPSRISHSLKWIWLVAGAVLVVVIAPVAWLTLHPPASRESVIHALANYFNSDVELKSFHLSVFPRIHAGGEGLVLRYHGRRDVPPLISIRSFSAATGWQNLLSTPLHVAEVRLQGLEIHVPPKGDQRSPGDSGKADKRSNNDLPFELDEVVADGTYLEILPRKVGKDPLNFELKRLALHSAGPRRPFTFSSTLTNPNPPGDIETTGQFGPWQRDDPSATPVFGNYDFRHADLDFYKGISGILSSKGSYKGVLERIEVTGNTDIPDFSLDVADHKVHLTTQFQAVVDGTDGDTMLDPVEAHFLKTIAVCRGGIEGIPGTHGKTIHLHTTVSHGRVEDLLRLAVKSNPPMTGAVSFTAELKIAPGQRPVIDKMSLAGDFGISSARFSGGGVQQKVNELSERSRGEPEAPAESVVSDLRGHFLLDNATARFSKLSFSVPGAAVSLEGTYGLRTEALDFHGVLRMDAKLSQTTTGVKSFLLKAVDPFFHKRGGGSVVPIKITGTRSNPQFGLELGGKK